MQSLKKAESLMNISCVMSSASWKLRTLEYINAYMLALYLSTSKPKASGSPLRH